MNKKGFAYRLLVISLCFLLGGALIALPLSQDAGRLAITIFVLAWMGLFILTMVGNEIYLHLKKKKQNDSDKDR